MTEAMPQPTALHRAALALHALDGADRQWLLEALSGQEQATLRPLLQELEELGIPRDAALSQVIADEPRTSAPGAAGLLQALDAQGVRRLAAMLCAEPPRLAAALAAASSAPWRAQLLAQLPPVHADAVRSQAHAGDAHALGAALLREVEARLGDACAQPVPTPAATSAWQAMARKLAALGRRA